MKLYACVTGAERGLGYEMAKVLLEDGYTVRAVGRLKWGKPLYPDTRQLYPGRGRHISSLYLQWAP